MESERLARRTPAVFEGVTYNLCGSFEALVEAETFFNATGIEVNLAEAIFNARDPNSALSGLRQLLPCALRASHPELGYGAVQLLIDRTVARDNPVFVEAIWRMWPAQEASSQAIMARFFERLPDEWKQEFFFQVIAERWPGAAQA